MLKKKLSVVTVLVGCVACLQGCVYADNKTYDKMTGEEKHQLRIEFYREADAIRNEFPEESLEREFADTILNTVEQGITR